MKKIINLHPDEENEGVNAEAIVEFDEDEGTMYMQILTYSYNNALTSVFVNFESPKEIIQLASALTAMAKEAKKFFEKNQ